MAQFEIRIEEYLSKIVTVEASDSDMALRIVRDRYHDEDIVLDYADFDDVEFSVQD